MPKLEQDDVELLKSWTLPSAATLGSSVRAHGILLEMRARLPASSKKLITLEAGELVLAMPASAKSEFNAAAGIISAAMIGIEGLPVIPREIQDILTIKPGERHRWLGDGRLPSAGTRTVRLAGRAKKITFHVFDPKIVEDLLNSGAVDEWREDDVAAATENRRRAAYKAKLTRSLKKGLGAVSSQPTGQDEPASELEGWDAFGHDGLLR
ncbi:hypothetical protein [Rhizobium sp. Leaf341]|uniref:hypothetical protein n=1 Tax=Rhizobium sp. Leaf341 TaxID=1736344 RepID=UPI0007140307|nr:hypothetical protein [Rhizobium sp. Leaf341]KQR75865.1 hypothetical protein ASG03_19590 [Rhizobium sp. Leaf341]